MKKFIFAFVLSLSVAVSQYSFRTDHIGGAQRAGEKNTFRAAVLKNEKVLYTIERALPFDLPFPSTYVNEKTGILVLCFAFDGFVEMYDVTGEKIWEQNFFKEMEPNYERTITVALGEESIAFLTSDVMLPNAKVHFFSTNGAKQWEHELPYSMGYEIAMSPDEKTIVAGSYFVAEDKVNRSAAIISSTGKSSGTIDFLFRKAAFSKDNTLLALMSDREAVSVSMETKKELGRTSKQRADAIFTDVCWAGDTLVTQESRVTAPVQNRYYFSSPKFMWYSKSMAKISEEQFDGITYQRSRLVSSKKGVEFQFDQNKKVLQQK